MTKGKKKWLMAIVAAALAVMPVLVPETAPLLDGLAAEWAGAL